MVKVTVDTTKLQKFFNRKISGKFASDARTELLNEGSRIYANLLPNKLQNSVRTFSEGPFQGSLGSSSPIAHIIEKGRKSFTMRAPTRTGKLAYNAPFGLFKSATIPSMAGQYPLKRTFDFLREKTPSVVKMKFFE